MACVLRSSEITDFRLNLFLIIHVKNMKKHLLTILLIYAYLLGTFVFAEENASIVQESNNEKTNNVDEGYIAFINAIEECNKEKETLKLQQLVLEQKITKCLNKVESNTKVTEGNNSEKYYQSALNHFLKHLLQLYECSSFKILEKENKLLLEGVVADKNERLEALKYIKSQFISQIFEGVSINIESKRLNFCSVQIHNEWFFVTSRNFDDPLKEIYSKVEIIRDNLYKSLPESNTDCQIFKDLYKRIPKMSNIPLEGISFWAINEQQNLFLCRKYKSNWKAIGLIDDDISEGYIIIKKESENHE